MRKGCEEGSGSLGSSWCSRPRGFKPELWTVLSPGVRTPSVLLPIVSPGPSLAPGTQQARKIYFEWLHGTPRERGENLSWRTSHSRKEPTKLPAAAVYRGLGGKDKPTWDSRKHRAHIPDATPTAGMEIPVFPACFPPLWHPPSSPHPLHGARLPGWCFLT